MTRCAAMVMVMAFLASVAQAQSERPGGYPVKPIRFLVGNAPGGGIDITARAVGQKLTERWGRSVVVDNRPGASGIIAMEVAAQAVPDGYTLLVISGSLIASAGVQKKVAFDVRRAYAPVTQFTTVAYMLMINAGLPPNNVKEFIAYAKARPDALSYGSSGVGGAGHLAGALFCDMAGVKITHVPYKGGGLVLADMIGGQVQMGFTATLSGMPHVRGGKLKALGITSLKRSAAFPEVPTIAEAGVPGFELINWYGLFAPAATPRPVIAALHREIARNLGAPEVQNAFAKDGAEATPSATPDAFADLLAQELKIWERFVKLPGFAENLR
ncbi:MAG: tripartite tricarboxylate transporter substrate binding protein [Burkholderiales bacterium]